MQYQPMSGRTLFSSILFNFLLHEVPILIFLWMCELITRLQAIGHFRSVTGHRLNTSFEILFSSCHNAILHNIPDIMSCIDQNNDIRKIIVWRCGFFFQTSTRIYNYPCDYCQIELLPRLPLHVVVRNLTKEIWEIKNQLKVHAHQRLWQSLCDTPLACDLSLTFPLWYFKCGHYDFIL